MWGGRGTQTPGRFSQHAVPPGRTVRRPEDVLTTRARGENDVLCQIGCLFFDSEAGVRGFLNTGGNAALLDGPLVQVRGLRRPGGDGLALGVP